MINDNHEVAVGQNLFDFLLVCDVEYEGLWFWVDQICIDQNSVEEKNQQVALMGEIFQHAEETIAWLGPDLDAGIALTYIKEILKMESEVPMALGFMKLDEQEHRRRDTVWGGWDLTKHPKEEQALHNLWNLPYWSRHWIAQEVALARTCCILYGTARIGWADFIKFQKSLLGKLMDYDELSGLRLAPLLRFTEAMRHDWRSDEYIWEVATTFAKESLCRDARDKVYGVRSLFRQELRPVVNYSLPTWTVYLTLVRTWYAKIEPALDVPAFCCWYGIARQS